VLASRAPRLSNAVVQNQTTSDSWQQLLEMPRKSWWARLPFGVRMAVGASAVLIVVGAGATGVATLAGGGGKPGPRIVTEVNQAAPAAQAEAQPPVPVPVPVRAEGPHTDKPRSISKNREKGVRPLEPSAAPSPSVAAPVEPVQKTQTETETREIPYETRVVHDPALPRGAKKVETPGVNGVETLRYLVTLTDGRPTDRKLIDAVVTRRPQHQVVALGTRHPTRSCGDALNFCVPLGRKPVCPDHGREEDASIPLPDLVLHSDDLGYLEGLAC